MTGKSFKITVMILSGILVTVVIAFVLFAVVNGFSTRYMISKVFPGTVENVYKPYKIVEEKISQTASVVGCDGYVYVLDDKNITVYDARGSEQYSDILSFEDPEISSGSDRVFIFDRPTGNYLIFEEGYILFTDTVGKTILGARVQDNRYIVLILKGRDGFLGSTVVINEKNDMTAEYDYADRFPVSACAIGDSGIIAAAGIFENDTGKTGIDLFEEYKEVPVAGIIRDNIIPLILPIGSKSFAAAGNDTIIVFSHEGAELASHNLNEVIRMDTSKDGCWVADRKTGSDRIICINESGTQKWQYPTGTMTEGMTIGERHIFFWSGINSGCLDEKGRPIELQSGYDAVQGIADIGNGKIVTVTTGGLIFYEYH